MKISIKKSTLRRTLLWGVVGILFIAVIYMTFLKGSVSTSHIESAKVAGQVATQYSGMVGGC